MIKMLNDTLQTHAVHKNGEKNFILWHKFIKSLYIIITF